MTVSMDDVLDGLLLKGRDRDEVYIRMRTDPFLHAVFERVRELCQVISDQGVEIQELRRELQEEIRLKMYGAKGPHGLF